MLWQDTLLVTGMRFGAMVSLERPLSTSQLEQPKSSGSSGIL